MADSTQTPLDEALKLATQDQNQANYFYDSFLNAELFFPASITGTSTSSWKEIGPTENFHPLFAQFPECKAVPVFDSIERLKGWAGEQILDYVRIKGFILLKILDVKIALVLNPGFKWNYTLTPDILNKIRNAMKTVLAN